MSHKSARVTSFPWGEACAETATTIKPLRLVERGGKSPPYAAGPASATFGFGWEPHFSAIDACLLD